MLILSHIWEWPICGTKHRHAETVPHMGQSICCRKYGTKNAYWSLEQDSSLGTKTVDSSLIRDTPNCFEKDSEICCYWAIAVRDGLRFEQPRE